MLFSNPNTDKSLLIAEVGQNHQGDIEMARDYVRIFAMAGADVVKFQTRNNKYLFSESAYNAPYSSENAFAPIYGQHREKLELKPSDLEILKADCKKYGVKFMSTPFDEPSLQLLMDLDVDLLKVASFDLGNLPFLKKIAQTGKPIVMSIGGGLTEHIRASVELIGKYNKDLAILHCVSEYPCEASRLGLSNIEFLRTEFPDFVVGLSDHFNGILSGPIAYMKGARVFEKHVTLNRSWKGTDHSFALEPDGFRKFVRDIHRVPEMMPPKPKSDLGKEGVFKKLGKSVVTSKSLKKGHRIEIDDLSGKIFQETITPVRDSVKVIGKVLKLDLESGAPVRLEDLES